MEWKPDSNERFEWQPYSAAMPRVGATCLTPRRQYTCSTGQNCLSTAPYTDCNVIDDDLE